VVRGQGAVEEKRKEEIELGTEEILTSAQREEGGRTGREERERGRGGSPNDGR